MPHEDRVRCVAFPLIFNMRTCLRAHRVFAGPRPGAAEMRLLFSIACLLRCGSALVRRSAPRQLPVTWSNPQGAVLTPIGDDIWLAERPFYPRLPGLQGTDVGCKAVVVRLPDDTLWVHAPVGLDGPLLEALAALGPVKHIVTPNTEHQKFAPSWLLAFPKAVGYACPGLLEKKQEGGWARSLVELLEPDGVTSAAITALSLKPPRLHASTPLTAFTASPPPRLSLPLTASASEPPSLPVLLHCLIA